MRNLIIIFLLFSKITLSQGDYIYHNQSVQIYAGISVGAGTHQNRIGVFAGINYPVKFIQFSAEARYHFHLKDFGPPGKYHELILSPGICLAWGKKDSSINRGQFFSGSNQSSSPYSFSYVYNLHFTNNQTTQQTGIVYFHLKNFILSLENDIFARQFYDRFRTGAFGLQYKLPTQANIGMQVQLWTGKFGGVIRSNDTIHFKNGYVNDNEGKYTQYSNGILNFYASGKLPYGNWVRGSIGIDHEKIRHVVQNKMIHDLAFLPKKWFKRNNAHIPMIDSNGKAFLHLENQKLRPNKPLINLYLNPTQFY